MTFMFWSTTWEWHALHRRVTSPPRWVRWRPDMPVPLVLWHAVQASGPARVNAIVPLLPRPLPWQYSVEQVAVALV